MLRWLIRAWVLSREDSVNHWMQSSGASSLRAAS